MPCGFQAAQPATIVGSMVPRSIWISAQLAGRVDACSDTAWTLTLVEVTMMLCCRNRRGLDCESWSGCQDNGCASWWPRGSLAGPLHPLVDRAGRRIIRLPVVGADPALITATSSAPWPGGARIRPKAQWATSRRAYDEELRAACGPAATPPAAAIELFGPKLSRAIVEVVK